MKDYASMSDQQINREVQKLTGTGCMAGSGVLIISNGMWRTFDPCNNPADAWPIIVENKISTMWMTAEKEWCAWSGGDLEEGCWEWGNIPDYYFCGESPLRAAMIAFLMMKDGE